MALVADAARPGDIVSRGMTFRASVADNHVTTKGVDDAMVAFVGVADAAYPTVDFDALWNDSTPATTRAF